MNITEVRDKKSPEALEPKDTITPVEDRVTEAVEEMEQGIVYHDEIRRFSERAEWADLNQGFQTGTYNSAHIGIRWGPSHRIRPRPAKPTQPPEKPEKDSGSKP